MSISFYGRKESAKGSVSFGVQDDEPSMTLANGNFMELLEALGLGTECPDEVTIKQALDSVVRAAKSTKARTVTGGDIAGYVERFRVLLAEYKNLGCTHVYWA